MIVGEVKEGRARLNKNTTDPRVLAAVLVRFGCCKAEVAPSLARRLARQRRADLPNGHRIRLVVFAGQSDGERTSSGTVVTLGHVVRFLKDHLDEHWDVLRHAQLKDPALGFLATVQKARRLSPASD
jgi:hypothetical protein